jgi:hypothetical protein
LRTIETDTWQGVKSGVAGAPVVASISSGSQQIGSPLAVGRAA